MQLRTWRKNGKFELLTSARGSNIIELLPIEKYFCAQSCRLYFTREYFSAVGPGQRRGHKGYLSLVTWSPSPLLQWSPHGTHVGSLTPL